MAESFALIAKQGYQRLLLDGRITRLEEALPALERQRPGSLVVVQDRLQIGGANRARFVEACEQAYHFGQASCASTGWAPAAAWMGRDFFPAFFIARSATSIIASRRPRSSAFNHPVGACPTCRGFGRVIGIDYDLAIPDRSKTLAAGAVKPWQSGRARSARTT